MEKEKKENLKKNNTNNVKIKSKISLIIIISVIVVILVVLLTFMFKNKNGKNDINYESKMQDFGFDLMYDKNSIGENITKSEAIKLVVSSMLNESNVANLVDVEKYVEELEKKNIKFDDNVTLDDIENKLEYKNKMWVDFATDKKIIEKNQITEKNENENAKYIDVLNYLAQAKSRLLNKPLDKAEDLKIKNVDSYKVNEQVALNDMVYNKIIENKNDKFKDNVKRDRFNKLLIDMAIEYNTITVKDEKININKSKEPSNVKEYPYTIASVNKKIYELKNSVKNKEKYKNPKEMYKDYKKYYNQISNLIEDHFNTLLNIDYSKFDENKFIEMIKETTYDYESEENIKKYVEYVKKNKIKMTGTSKVIYPAIYFDGENMRARVKIDYKIENADVKENLIYGDFKNNETIKYDKDEDSIIVDMVLKKSSLYNILYVHVLPLKNIIAGK